MRRPGTPASRRSGRAIRCAPTTATGCSRCARPRDRPRGDRAEAPLVAGVADLLRRNGIAVFGPSAEAARIEGSKASPRTCCGRPVCRQPRRSRWRGHRACSRPTDSPPARACSCAIPARSSTPALPAVEALGQGVVIEELLEGYEVSLFALCDGRRVLPLGSAQDFKRAEDGDAGPNTGGMGAYSPVAEFDGGALVSRDPRTGAGGTGTARCTVHRLSVRRPDDHPRRAARARVQRPARRPGDSGFDAAHLRRPARGVERSRGRRPLRADLTLDDRAAVTVVLTSPEYPERSDYPGLPITGLEDAEATGALVFQGGTAARDGRVTTQGGRILSVTATADTIPAARDRAYDAVHLVSFEGARFRRDIAAAVGR